MGWVGRGGGGRISDGGMGWVGWGWWSVGVGVAGWVVVGQGWSGGGW